MNQLLVLSIGPVQEFIQAARRTRDLWFGSRLLSEISKAAARCVRARGGDLIFPAPSDDRELEPDSPLNVANIVLAELDGGNPQEIADAANQAALSRWHNFADSVLRKHSRIIDSRIWNAQTGDVIEFYSAWCPFTRDAYREDRKNLMRLLAARKNCRNFEPAESFAGYPNPRSMARAKVFSSNPGRIPPSCSCVSETANNSM